MSFLAKVSTFFGLEDEEYMEEEYTTAPQPVVSHRTENVTAQKSTFKPRATKQTQVTNQAINQVTQSRPVTRAQATVEQPTRQQNVFERPKQPVQQEKKVVAMNQTQNKQVKPSATKDATSSKILIVEPRVYSEAMNIAKHVMSGESVLVNFRLIEEYQARRIVDFLTGTVYAEDGDIKRVADEIFLCTPKGIEIDGTAQSLVDSNMFDI